MMSENNDWEIEEQRTEDDRQTAISIMRSLVDSTYAEELRQYEPVVKEHLGLDDKTMERLFNFSTLVNLLILYPSTKRYFHGKRVPPNGTKPLLFRSFDTEHPRKRFCRDDRKIFEKIRAPSSLLENPQIDEEAHVENETHQNNGENQLTDLDKPFEPEEQEPTVNVLDQKENKDDTTEHANSSSDVSEENTLKSPVLSLLKTNSISTDGLVVEFPRKAVLIKVVQKQFGNKMVNLGGKFSTVNGGWIFSKKKIQRLCRALSREETNAFVVAEHVEKTSDDE